ncbi:unnamed protein product [Rotaria socialis]|uniref:G-protein coupled receptors family 1 profile domain-containing protein n=2 Tax=Rotaria socialis TaxID=392032 RepID=A0A818F1S4_9BILA|nr:unnamed protein product [Rotaria socialis]CAF3468206.1 unnamed protein product [Rotaria socialis]CAF3791105.1 unnamed protein product [Rotaria socialis]CAF4352463.1 unnamed protein product [Rotaria socialis]CAF4356786.1 unnamed protein product [Rotaria socialis]
MFSTTDTKSVDLLNSISIQFNRYFSIFIFLFGMTGNILNCFVLSQPTLRVNPCAYLFLASSIANVISISFGLTTRILSGWNTDFTDTHSLICKIRVFIMFVSRTTAFWLIAFATIDRWFTSCYQYQRRQMSSLKNSQRATWCITVLSILFYCQVLYCYEANIDAAPLRCYGRNVKCRLLTDITYASVTIFSPILIMSIFGFMTISNIRDTYSVSVLEKRIFKRNTEKHKTLSMTIGQRERWRKIDRYLRRVLFIQIILLIIFTLPQVIDKFYMTSAVHRKKSLLHTTIDTFIYNFVLLLTYAASGIPFYIYTLCGGSIFRTTLMTLLRMMIEKISCR